MPDEPDDSIWVETMIASKTGEPLVVLRWYDRSGELTPSEARTFALQVLAAADAAESDAFVYDFMFNKMGAPKEDAALMIRAFREYREEKQG